MATYKQDAGVPGTTAEDGTVAMNETDRLIASDKVEGTAVYNRAGESLVTVYNFMVDKYSGKVAYAVMSFGGFLGIGERYHALPWEKLDYDASMGGYVVDIDRATLERDWAASEYGREVPASAAVEQLAKAALMPVSSFCRTTAAASLS